MATTANPLFSSSINNEIHNDIVHIVHKYFKDDTDLFTKIKSLINDKKSRLILGIHEFDQINSVLAKRILSNPLVYLSAAEDAYNQFYENVVNDVGASKTFAISRRERTAPKLGIKDWLGSHTVTPRGLSARLVNRLVCVEGIVTRCSLVHPKLSRSVLIADNSGFTITRPHYDASSLQKDYAIIPRGQPKTDNDNNLLKVEVGLCEYKDFQRITVQEMPESAPTGQLPRSVEVILEEDLVDAAKPGDRVRCWGIYRVITAREGNRVPGYANTFLICNHIEQLRQNELTPEISPVDIRFIRELASRSDIFDLLSRSIAPSICGHELVKKGLLLQLFGGERKELENGMRLRGDIHVLLIGDPSCGKSQMLRFMMNISPLALSTTGRGSSGVGLTAAVTTDKDTGERKLEAGAMVLGDGGLVCIDEFDKMSYEDRVAIHEVLEQQTVTISKAGIQTTLNARTSVLAAANPVYGTFDPEANLKSQINFPDSLLTRFDLIYIIRDAQTAEEDRRICSQVLRQLQYRAGTTGDSSMSTAIVPKGPASGGGVNPRSGNSDEAGVIQAVPDKRQLSTVTEHNTRSHYWETSITPAITTGGKAKVTQVLSVEFLRKYIHYARFARPSPILADDAIESIADFYANLRQMCASRPEGKRSHVIPTARCLEACVRLATAHARLKLKSHVDSEDAQEVQQLLLFTLLGELPAAQEHSVEPEDQIPSHENRRTDTSGTSRRKRARTEVIGETGERLGASKRRQSITTVTTEAATSQESLSTAAAATVQTQTATRATRSNTRSSGKIDVLDSSLNSIDRTKEPLPDDNGGRSQDSDDDVASQRSLESVENQGSSIIGTIAPKRLQILTSTMSAIKNAMSSGENSLPSKQVLEKVNEIIKGKKFSSTEFRAGLYRLQAENKIMIVHGDLWFI